MGSKDLGQIYTKFKANFADNPEYVKTFFRTEADGLNRSGITDHEDLQQYSELAWHHVNALLASNHYNEAADEADRLLNILAARTPELSHQVHAGEWHSGLIFLKGMALYKLRQFSGSVQVFRHLCESDPGNDLYRKWLRDARYGSRLRLIHGTWALSAIILLFVLFFSEYIHSPVLKFGLTALGFAGVVWNLGFEFYAKRSLRRLPAAGQ